MVSIWPQFKCVKHGLHIIYLRCNCFTWTSHWIFTIQYCYISSLAWHHALYIPPVAACCYVSWPSLCPACHLVPRVMEILNNSGASPTDETLYSRGIYQNRYIRDLKLVFIVPAYANHHIRQSADTGKSLEIFLLTFIIWLSVVYCFTTLLKITTDASPTHVAVRVLRTNVNIVLSSIYIREL